MTYSQALEFLDSFVNYERTSRWRYPEDLSLERISKLLERLGNPHQRYPTLHVAGTKGKGSTCALAASILQTQGLSVGLYTSPHLISFQERMKINGELIFQEDLARIVEEVKPEALAVAGLTFFELVTACAFLYFAKAGVDAAVVEVGLGGRWDATNVLTPKVSVITPVSFDHLPQLGPTLKAIALEKAGIVKSGVPVVSAPQSPQAQEAIAQTAASLSAPVHWIEKQVLVSSAAVNREGSRFTLQTPRACYPDLQIPLLGRHQMMNAAVAVRAVELFAAQGFPLTGVAVRKGLEKVQWPGRCQLVSGGKGQAPLDKTILRPTGQAPLDKTILRPTGQADLLLDGAQNAASAQVLRSTLEELFAEREITLVFGASVEKDLEGMAKVLGPISRKLILTQAQNPRAQMPEPLQRAFYPWHPVPLVAYPVAQALDQAQSATGPEGLIVVTGSLFVVAEALEALEPVSELSS